MSVGGAERDPSHGTRSVPAAPTATPCPHSEIDKTLENMSSYRKNKWIIEGRLRR